VLGADAIAYSMVTLDLRERFFPTILVDSPMAYPTLSGWESAIAEVILHNRDEIHKSDN
jgi:hypothetical protein